MIKKSLTAIIVVLFIGYFLFDCYVGSLTSDKFILQGKRALLDKQYTQAIDYLDQAYKEILRSNQSAFFSKGLTMDKMGDLRTINYLQGKAHFSLEQYDKALEHLNKSIEMDPYHHPSYSKRGETFTRLKQFDKALADYGYDSVSYIAQEGLKGSWQGWQAGGWGSLVQEMGSSENTFAQGGGQGGQVSDQRNN